MVFWERAACATVFPVHYVMARRRQQGSLHIIYISKVEMSLNRQKVEALLFQQQLHLRGRDYIPKSDNRKLTVVIISTEAKSRTIGRRRFLPKTKSFGALAGGIHSVPGVCTRGWGSTKLKSWGVGFRGRSSAKVEGRSRGSCRLKIVSG